jgi:hypothetical protein
LNSELHTCKEGVLSFESHSQPYLLSYFFNRISHLCSRWPGLWSSYLCFPSFRNGAPPWIAFIGWDSVLPRLASNHDPAYLHLLSSLDYTVPSHIIYFLMIFMCVGGIQTIRNFYHKRQNLLMPYMKFLSSYSSPSFLLR